jgi:hypothetical protein
MFISSSEVKKTPLTGFGAASVRKVASQSSMPEQSR